MKQCYLFFLYLIQYNVLAGNYLFWIPFGSKSHKIGLMEVGEELGRRGHQVTVVSPQRYKKVPPNVTDIVIQSEFEALSKRMTNDLLTNDDRPSTPFVEIINVSVENNRDALLTPAVQELLKNNKIDVVIVIPSFGNEAGYYVAHKLNASLVFFTTVPYSQVELNWAIGDPFNTAFTPNIMLGLTQNMNFKERLINTVFTTCYLLVRKFFSQPKVHTMLTEVFPEDTVPAIDDLSRTSALYINHGSPFFGDGLRPTSPKTVQAGLMNCSPAQPLPQHLANFVEAAEHGVILVSFGSILEASKMPEYKRLMMLRVFSRLKQRVIWKWETEMPDAPQNVLISSWLPQTSLLAHQNVKVFITHGGSGSFQETICHKTPIVGIPLVGDQTINVKEAVNRNIGVAVPWFEMEEAAFENAINEVLTNPVYQRSIEELSSLILDQPQHPLSLAVWWLEYLLRHPHNPRMKPHSHQLYWFQYFLLDVLAALLLTSSLLISITYKLICWCCRRRNTEKTKKKD